MDNSCNLYRIEIMEKGAKDIMVEFNDYASGLLQMLFRQFESMAISLNRDTDDNTYQQLQGKFIYTFKLQMENMALQLIEKRSSGGDTDNFKRSIRPVINAYLNEFMRKAKSL